MPTVELDEETIERLDGSRIDDGSADGLVDELDNSYRTTEITLDHATTVRKPGSGQRNV